MKRIFKYDLTVSEITIPMPKGAEILHVAEQGWELRLWALVDTDRPIVDRKFFVVGTGHTFDPSGAKHLATVLAANGLVWHVFETPQPGPHSTLETK